MAKKITFILTDQEFKDFEKIRQKRSKTQCFRDFLSDQKKAKSKPDSGIVQVPEFTPEFEAFFEAYPRPEGKISAFMVWQNSLIDQYLAEKIDFILWVFKHKNRWNYDSEDGRFWPKPADFLAQKMWLDCTKKLVKSCHFFDEPAKEKIAEKFFPKNRS